jgi:hypothetical protein
MKDLKKLIKAIQNSLSDDLLKPQFRGVSKNRFYGHCYVATECLYHLLPQHIKSSYKPNTLKINGITHWFLKNKETGEVLDLTSKQFTQKIEYYNSRGCGFLTKKPSKRAVILIDRVLSVIK